jgi:tetratricopeptide (TPR) repeat protein
MKSLNINMNELIRLGIECKHQAKIDDALAVFKKVLRKDPENVRALYQYCLLLRIEPDDPVIPILEKMGADPVLAAENSAIVKFALAKIRLDQGEDEIAFTLFQQANAQIYAIRRPAEPDPSLILAFCHKYFSAAQINNNKKYGVTDRSQVFVIGGSRLSAGHAGSRRVHLHEILHKG